MWPSWPDGDKSELQASDSSKPEKNPAATVSSTLSQAMRTRALWLLIFAGSAQSLIGTGVMFHQVEIMSTKGLSTAVSAGVFGVIAPALIAGQFISGYLASRFEERYLIAIGQVLLVGNILLLLTISEAWHAYVYGVALGINMGFLMNSMQSVWPAYFGRQHLGSIRGVTNFGIMASAALGPLPLAAAIDLSDSYTPGLIAYMTLPPLCAIAALAAGGPATYLREHSSPSS